MCSLLTLNEYKTSFVWHAVEFRALLYDSVCSVLLAAMRHHNRKIDRDRKIQRERMKVIPPEGFLSLFYPTDHQRPLAPLCLLCCQ